MPFLLQPSGQIDTTLASIYFNQYFATFRLVTVRVFPLKRRTQKGLPDSLCQAGCTISVTKSRLIELDLARKLVACDLQPSEIT
jgi:hypothetical protein